MPYLIFSLCVMCLWHLSSFQEKMRKTYQNEWPALIKLMFLREISFDSTQWNITFRNNEFISKKSITKCTPTKSINSSYFKGNEEKNRVSSSFWQRINMSARHIWPLVWGTPISNRCSAFSNSHELHMDDFVLEARRNRLVHTF